MAEQKALTYQCESVDPPKESDRESLRASFELFARMSDELSSSYHSLERQVHELSEELSRVNREHEKQLREKHKMQAKLSNLLDFLPGGVIVIDRWGAVAQANPVACELLGRDILGCRWIDVIAESFAPRDDDGHEISLRNGRLVSLSTRSLDAEVGQIILLTDQTETRESQRRMARNERLSAMGKMISALAHQVRTPLSAAMLYTGHLCDRSLNDVQVKEFSGKVMSRLQHIEQQVRDMLIFAKGDLPIAERISIATLFADLKQAAEAHSAKLEFVSCLDKSHELIELACNRQALIGAIMNVIDNAAQASQIDSLVSVRFSIDSIQNVIIRVEDNGQGIPQSILQRLKSEELFVSSKSDGTGLGLAVVRSVIAAHRGKTNIESEEGAGTCVQIELPLLGYGK